MHFIFYYNDFEFIFSLNSVTMMQGYIHDLEKEEEEQKKIEMVIGDCC